MVTLKDVAEACGVSTATVSNIINGKSKASEQTVKLVLDTVKRMDYHPNLMAKSLRTQHTKTVAIIAEDVKQFTTPFIVEAVMSGLEAQGYSTVLHNLRVYDRWQDTWFDSNSALWSLLEPVLEHCRTMNVDGIIYIAGHARNIHCIPKDYPIPIVMTYAYATDEHIPSVVIDDEQGAYEVMKALLSRGHRKIAVITGRDDNIHTRLRLNGLMRAMYEYGCPLNPDLIGNGRWSRESGRAAMEKLPILESGVTAVFSMNDEMAAGVYDYIESIGLRPGVDISVVGFDNAEISGFFRPGLSTAAIPLKEIGEKAAELLCEMLSEGEDKREFHYDVFRMKCSLVKRASVSEIIPEPVEETGETVLETVNEAAKEQ